MDLGSVGVVAGLHGLRVPSFPAIKCLSNEFPWYKLVCVVASKV
jgi:hypothetical protein